MAQSPDQQLQAMIDAMPEKSGRSLEAWFALLDGRSAVAHGAVMSILKDEFGVTHGYANTISQLHRQRQAGSTGADDLVSAQYAGAKAALLPIFERLLEEARAFGTDLEVSPKKAYVSLRRRKQFALVQPSTKDRLDLGLNLKGVDPQGRLEAAGSWNSMCTHRVRLTEPRDVDAEVIGWLRSAYDEA